MNFLAPAAFALSALAVPLVMLYMLRLRRTEVSISSTFLWNQLIHDREANAPWQRLRWNPLMLLQLLLLAALVLALTRPYWEVRTVSSGRIILLLDASASMGASDMAGGKTRWQAAQDAALGIVETLGRGGSMTVIRVAHAPEVLLAASQDKEALRAVIRRARVSQASPDWSAALTLAAAGGQGVENLNVVLISDGGLPSDLPLIAGELQYIPIGTASENLAISAFATRPRPTGGRQLFVQLANYGTQDAEAVFSLSLDGELFSAERYTLAAGKTQDVIIDDLSAEASLVAGTLQATAASTVPDYLAVDNQAEAVLMGGGLSEILLVTPRNLFLTQLFTSLPNTRLTQTTPELGLPNSAFDLYVFDGWLPPTLPLGDIFIINPPSDTPFFTLEGVVEDPNLARATEILRDDPRTRYLDFNEVNIRAFRRVAPIGDWAQVLVRASAGPLLLAGEAEGRQIALLTFALQDSDLPLQIAFPIMVSNLLTWYTPPRLLPPDLAPAPEDVVSLRVLEGDRVRITPPQGEAVLLPVNEGLTVNYAQTGQRGVYEVEALRGEQTLARDRFAVNLFDPAESQLRPRPEITLGAQTIGQTAREQVGQRELWPWLAWAALALLLAEWWYYHRTGGRILRPRRPVSPALAGRPRRMMREKG